MGKELVHPGLPARINELTRDPMNLPGVGSGRLVYEGMVFEAL
jgi:hypothetical protein